MPTMRESRGNVINKAILMRFKKPKMDYKTKHEHKHLTIELN